LLFPDGIQNIAGAGNLRKIDLGLDFVGLSAWGTRRLSRARCVTCSGTEMRPHFNGFVIFNGTGVGLFLGDPDF
jgi:hypothetical protein